MTVATASGSGSDSKPYSERQRSSKNDGSNSEPEESNDSDDDSLVDGSLEGESEDEWAEERRAMRYIAESELEDNSFSSEEESEVEVKPRQKKIESIGSLLRQKSKQLPQNNSKSSQVSSQSKSGNQKDFKKGKERNSSSDDDSESSEDPEDVKSSTRRRIPHRSNKNAPIETSSKKPITRKRTVVPITKIERRDPRFDSLSGAVNETLVEKSYSFLKSQRDSELENLREIVRKGKKGGNMKAAEVQKLEEEVRRMENFKVQSEKVSREKEALKKWKSQEKEKRKEGKTPYYLKKKDQKEIILADRLEHLSKDKRKLKKSMERKRKKISAKDKKSIPVKRVREE